MAAPHFRTHALALATLAALATGTTLAQTATATAETVTITGRTLAPLGVGGFGDMPLPLTPLQAMSFGRETLADFGVASLAALTRLDPAITDSYNSEGYWSFLTLRGFVIDNRANYRRDGLPINAETHLSLANKERVEVLKGTSGIQAGTSAPGGLVNLVVKRPQAGLRQGTLEWQADGSVSAQADLGERFGADGRFGVRVNLQAAELDPRVRNTQGRSHLAALATDWILDADRKLELEIERSHRSQPSVPGFSLLGDRLPPASSIDPRLNTNNQPWSQPVVLDGTTGSVRFTQRLAGQWRLVAHAARQRLRSEDRLAYPFGCYDAGSDTYHGDRFCPDGSFDLYDFRSEGERRTVDALDVHLSGQVRTGSLGHQLTLGMLRSKAQDRFQRQAFNYVGSGRISADVFTESDPSLTDESTNRDERSTELYLRDVVTLGPQWQLWGGLRHTRLERRSVRTDGSRATAYEQSFNTPWLALSWTPAPGMMVYGSAGQGIESEVAPNRSRYTNAGQVLPALKSRQKEVGVKAGEGAWSWTAAAFDIRRPLAEDLCSGSEEDLRCTRAVDGAARHRGVETSANWRKGSWSLGGGAMWLRAQREDSSVAELNGLRPTNVPSHTLRAHLAHELQALPDVTLQAGVVREGARAALPDNSVYIPAWTRLDLGLRWRQTLPSGSVLWRVDLLNATDHRAWRESPFQYGHAWLFPLTPRTWRVALQHDF